MKTASRTLKKLTFRTAAVLGFLTTLFSMNFLCKEQSHNWFAEIIRLPAMMRVNPVVHRPGFTSPLEKIAFDKSDNKSDNSDENDQPNRFGLERRSNDFSRGTDSRGVSAVRELAPDFSMIIPATMSPVSDLNSVSMQIVDHSVNAFFNQPSIKNTFVGRAAETVEKKLKAEVELGGTEPDSQKHNIKFQVRATESKASMEYRGITNCDLSYSVASQKANLEIFEPLTKNSNLVFTHSDAPSERRDVLSLRMLW